MYIPKGENEHSTLSPPVAARDSSRACLPGSTGVWMCFCVPLTWFAVVSNFFSSFPPSTFLRGVRRGRINGNPMNRLVTRGFPRRAWPLFSELWCGLNCKRKLGLFVLGKMQNFGNTLV